METGTNVVIGPKNSYDQSRFNGIKDKIIQLGIDINKKTNSISYLFFSGYRGLYFTYKNIEYIVIDQPGHVGLEDQAMPYITLQIGSKELLRFKPSSFLRRFGDVSMSDSMRDEAYSAILKYITELE